MKSLPIEIINSSNIILAARLDMPDDEYKATALFAHCFTCGKDILAASRISRELVKQGYAVLRFDFAGIGDSGGEFANTNFSSNVQDLIDATNWLRLNYRAPELMIGHSLGGTAILAASSDVPEAKSYVTIGSPSDPKLIMELIGEQNLRMIKYEGYADVNLEGRTFRIKEQFLEDISKNVVSTSIRKLNKPLMILHAPGDKTVPIEHATMIFHAAAHPKSFISLDNADHLITNKFDAEFIADVVGSWSKHYINNNRL